MFALSAYHNTLSTAFTRDEQSLSGISNTNYCFQFQLIAS